MNYRVGDLVYFRANGRTSIGRIESIVRPLNAKGVTIKVFDQRTRQLIVNPDAMWQTAEEYTALRAAKKIKLLFDNRAENRKKQKMFGEQARQKGRQAA